MYGSSSTLWVACGAAEGAVAGERVTCMNVNAAPCAVLARVANSVIISDRAKNIQANPCGAVGGASRGGRGRRGRRAPRARRAGRPTRTHTRHSAGDHDDDQSAPRPLYAARRHSRYTSTCRRHRPGGHDHWIESIFRTLGRYGRLMEVHFSRHALTLHALTLHAFGVGLFIFNHLQV